MITVDQIIHAKWIASVDDNNTIFEDSSLVIHEDRIIDILPTSAVQDQYATKHSIDRHDHLLIPGLINTHTHAAMSLLKGFADDHPLMTWLEKHIWPAEAQWVDADFVYDGAELAIAEMIRGGITCFNDMYMFPQSTAAAADLAGIRAVIGLIVLEFPTAYAANADEYFDKGLALHDELKHRSLIKTIFAPHAPYTVSDESLQRINMLAAEMDAGVHMHIHETAGEVDMAVAETGKRPLERLQALNMLTPNLLAVHMTQLTAEEIQLCAESGLHIAHCPESNLKLASGFAPIADLVAAGVNVTLGTDGSASNNDLNLLGEMRTAGLIAKGITGDATALPANTLLRMATINGAKALGLHKETGSLEIGKSADITAVDMSGIDQQPIYDPVSHLVYTCDRSQVSDVWVAGKQLLNEKQLTTLDETSILNKAKDWQEKIQGSTAQ